MARIYLEFMSLKLVKGSVPGLSKTGESGFASPPEGAHVGASSIGYGKPSASHPSATYNTTVPYPTKVNH
jgi:hypothetical protein